MMRFLLICLLAFPAACEEESPAPQEPEGKPVAKPDAPKIDVGAVLRRSAEFKKKLAKFKMAFDHKAGTVRALGEIAYRGGGPCEFLINVYPAKSHETIVLLDDGPWDGPGRRDTRFARGLATTLNNAFLAAGFSRGTPFNWNRETGEVFAPKGETVWIYCEWEDPETKKKQRALMSEWLWNYKVLRVMAPKKFVYTGSLMVDMGPPNHEKALGVEMDRLLVALLNTRTAMVDSIAEGSLDNGACEALAQRIPPIGTRVAIVFSRKKLEAKKHKPLELSKELLAERARRDAERAKEKREGKKPITEYRPPDARSKEDTPKEKTPKEEPDRDAGKEDGGDK